MHHSPTRGSQIGTGARYTVDRQVIRRLLRLPTRLVLEEGRIHSRIVTCVARSHSIEANLRPEGEHIGGSGFSTWGGILGTAAAAVPRVG